MTDSNIENRFENARKSLSETLKNLEEIIKQKIHESALQGRMISSVSENEIKNNQSALLEKTTTIENLNQEINNLQNNLLDLGKENDFLSKENKALTSKLTNSNSQQSRLIEAIESDLVKIEKVIKKEDK